MGDLISRQAAMVVFRCSGLDDDSKDTVVRVLEQLPSAQPKTQLSTEDATFDTTFDCISRQAAIDALWSLGVELRPSAIDAILNRLNGLPSAQPEIIRCKECKHFHYDMPYVIQGVPVLGHEVCDFWGDGCKTSENGFCSYAERITDE